MALGGMENGYKKIKASYDWGNDVWIQQTLRHQVALRGEHDVWTQQKLRHQNTLGVSLRYQRTLGVKVYVYSTTSILGGMRCLDTTKSASVVMLCVFTPVDVCQYVVQCLKSKAIWCTAITHPSYSSVHIGCQAFCSTHTHRPTKPSHLN